MIKNIRFFTFFSIFLFCFATKGISQSDFEILNQYITKISTLQENNDYDEIIELTKTSSKKNVNKKRNKELAIINSVANANIKSQQSEFINESITEQYASALHQSRKIGNKQLETWCSLNFAFYFYNHLQYKFAISFFLPALSYLKENPSEQQFDSFNIYKRISYFLTFVKDGRESNYFLNKATLSAKSTPQKLATTYYLMGNNSIQDNQFTEAKDYLLLGEKYALKYNDQNYLSRIYGSLALVYQHENDYKTAEKLFLQDRVISQKIKSHKNFLYATTKLAALYIETKQYSKIKLILQELYNYQKIDKKSYNWYEIDILKLHLQYVIHNGEDEKELALRRFVDSLTYIEQLSQDEQVYNSYWVNQKSNYQIQNEKNKIKLYQSQNRFAISIIIAIALFIIGIVISLSFYIKKKREKTIFRQMIVELLSKNKKIKINNDELQHFAKEKEFELIALKDYYIKIETDYIKYAQNHNDYLNELLGNHIMTEETWIEFKKAFDKKFPDFLPYIHKHFEGLTESNLKTILLLKLNLSPGEMSKMLGISPDSVRKSIKRLQIKLGEKFDLLFDKSA